MKFESLNAYFFEPLRKEKKKERKTDEQNCPAILYNFPMNKYYVNCLLYISNEYFINGNIWFNQYNRGIKNKKMF